MGIIINADTKAIVQGITGKQGSYHTKLMLDYGTKIVAGVVPGKGGTTADSVPVYDTVKETVEAHSPNASIIFVPAPFAQDAVLEAIANEIKTIVVITEHLPIKDAISVMANAKQSQVTIIGPNTPGIITPGQCKLGIMPANIFKPGSIGVVSRSGTLTYEIAAGLTAKGLGQSTCLGVGGDPIVGLNFIDTLELFKDNPDTNAIVLIGEIGGNMEELTAEYITQEHYPKPIVAYVAGRFAPSGKRMGHAGAIIMGKQGTAQSKIEALINAGVKVAEKPSDVATLLGRALLP
ncbi:MAG TPA: succinate--CoA ligase subunit alpha [Verrucomicrobiae bacterium]|nr:succinate--CoA ligase subunit alpha [Verrucomicrobiae bacterium]